MSRENNPNCPIKHFVMLKWKEGTTQEQIDAFRLWNREMADDIAFAYDYESGPALEPRYHNAYFDFCIMMTFYGGYDSMDTFMSHWSHLRESPVCAIIDQVMAFNFEVNEYGKKKSEVDPEAVLAEREVEKVRCAAISDDPTKATVPDLRGHFLEDAKEMIEAAGLVLDDNVVEIMGASWAPGRVNSHKPAPFTEVEPGSKVTLEICGDYLMGVDVPYVIEGGRAASPTNY